VCQSRRRTCHDDVTPSRTSATIDPSRRGGTTMSDPSEFVGAGAGLYAQDRRFARPPRSAWRSG
jgi:hypothetical protein